MAKNRKVLVVESLTEQIKVARLINSLVAKIANRETLSDPIRVSFNEAELLNEIVVSYRP